MQPMLGQRPEPACLPVRPLFPEWRPILSGKLRTFKARPPWLAEAVAAKAAGLAQRFRFGGLAGQGLLTRNCTIQYYHDSSPGMWPKSRGRVQVGFFPPLLPSSPSSPPEPPAQPAQPQASLPMGETTCFLENSYILPEYRSACHPRTHRTATKRAARQPSPY